MARRNNTEELIRCQSCGEDYSATYKSCPFCGQGSQPRSTSPGMEDDDGYVFDGQDVFDNTADQSAPRGGKRLAGSDQQSKASAPINWPRLITFLCSLIIIVAALIIIFAVIYPQVHDNPVPSAEPSVSVEPSQPAGSTAPTDPSAQPSAEPSVEPTAPPSPLPSKRPLSLKSITMRPNDYDFTLSPGESHTLQPTFDPVDWSGTVSYTSSNPEYAAVDAAGKVTNVSTEVGGVLRVTITVTSGGQSVPCTVYCRGLEEEAPPTPSKPSTDSLTPGSTGTITGADGGLRVRSGPGTDYRILATLVNGNTVTIVGSAGGGWYEIKYVGSGGASETGYILGEYISAS